MRVPDFEDLDASEQLDKLDELIDQHGRDPDSGRALLEEDEESIYLDLGGKRLYSPEARAARQVELAEAIRAGDVREVIYHYDGQVSVEYPDGRVEPDRVLFNNREDQKAARIADSKSRVSGWFT